MPYCLENNDKKKILHVFLTNTFPPDSPLLIGFLDMETVNTEGTLYMGREKARRPAPRHGCLGPQPDLPGLGCMGPGKWLRVWKAGKLQNNSHFQPLCLLPPLFQSTVIVSANLSTNFDCWVS